MVNTSLLVEEYDKVGIWFVHTPTNHPLILLPPRLYMLVYEPTFLKSENSLPPTYADSVIAKK